MNKDIKDKEQTGFAFAEEANPSEADSKSLKVDASPPKIKHSKTKHKSPKTDDSKEKDNRDLDVFLLQISTENIFGYFNRGILMPDKYMGNRTRRDIQSEYKNYLVFTKNKYIKTKEKQFLLEVVLSKDEMSSLIKTNNEDVFLYSKPLPISRVFKIYYNEEEDIKDVTSLSKVGKDSPLINNHEKIKNFEKIENFDDFSLKDKINKEYDSEINMYDKIMGMFAFMKNTPLYYGHCANYSDNYFEALSVINKDIGKKISKNNKSLNIFKSMIKNKSSDPFFNKLLNIIYSKEEDIEGLKNILVDIQDSLSPDDAKIQKRTLSQIKKTLKEPIKSYKASNYTDDIILLVLKIIATRYVEIEKTIKSLETEESKVVGEVISLSESSSLEKNNRLDLLKKEEKLKTSFYIVYLEEYGDRKGDSHINLKNTIHDDLPEEYAEEVLGLMGIHFGYSVMLQNEEININKNANYLFQDKTFKNIIPKDVNIKFNLDSRLDYQTIESIYLYAFNNKKTDANLEYLLLDDVNSKQINYDFDKIDDRYDVLLDDYSDKKYFCIKNK